MHLRVRSEVLIFRDGKALANLAKGYVCFPGGGIDPKETPVEAAKRECLEEADRVLISCTPAHPATDQRWSASFKARKAAWCNGYEGGRTHWMTGSSSLLPYHPDPRMRHNDFEAGFTWYAPATLLAKLDREADGDWADDVRVRCKILRAMIAMHKEAMFPRLVGTAHN